MFSKRDFNKISFYGVALALILFGAVIAAIGLAAWFLSAMGFGTICAYPFFKVMGGVVILGIGYIILEVELLRKK